MLNKRQKAILEYVEKHSPIGAEEILKGVRGDFDQISKPTLLRDLDVILKSHLIQRRGRARAVVYASPESNPLLGYIDADKYFLQPPDERSISQQFNWGVFDNLSALFKEPELRQLKKMNEQYRLKRSHLEPAALQKEIERITIELSWKSSQLEGNTYTLIDTEVLIKEAQEAAGHPKTEAIMILNHKRALDYIFNNRQSFTVLTLSQLRSVHALLIRDLGVSDNFRSTLVGITGTKYRPLDNQFQIIEALEKMTMVINIEREPAAKALIALALISYIQAFVDGNKRTARLMTNAVLLASEWCPLSLRSINGAEYKKALLLFYEQNNLRYLKQLFMEQFKFAVENYFG